MFVTSSSSSKLFFRTFLDFKLFFTGKTYTWLIFAFHFHLQFLHFIALLYFLLHHHNIVVIIIIIIIFFLLNILYIFVYFQIPSAKLTKLAQIYTAQRLSERNEQPDKFLLTTFKYHRMENIFKWILN